MPPAGPPEDAIVPEGADWIWHAFLVLHGDRPMLVQGFGTPMGATIIESIPSKIRFADIDCYARRYRIEGEWFDMLVLLIEVLDREYLDYASAKAAERWARLNQGH